MIGWTGEGRLYSFHKTYWTITWKFVTPALLTVILAASVIDYKPMTYGDSVYPVWANGLGWAVSMVSVACIPLVMLWKVVVVMQGRWKIISKDDRWDELIKTGAEWGRAERQYLKKEQNKREKIHSDTLDWQQEEEISYDV